MSTCFDPKSTPAYNNKAGGIVKVLAYGVPILECQHIGVAVVVRKSMREMGLTRNQLFSINERVHVFVPAKTSDQVTFLVFVLDAINWTFLTCVTVLELPIVIENQAFIQSH